MEKDRCPNCNSYKFQCGTKDQGNGVLEVSEACKKISRLESIYRGNQETIKELKEQLAFIAASTRPLFFSLEGKMTRLLVLDLQAATPKQQEEGFMKELQEAMVESAKRNRGY